MRRILLLGGSGFVGRALLAELMRRPASAELSITVPTRRRERVKELIVLPNVELIEADVHQADALARLMAGQEAVINLIGILHDGAGEPYGQGRLYGPGFARVHVELPRKIAAAAKAAGVDRVLHISALKAAPAAPSGYLRSKAAGEAALREAGLEPTIFQPAVIFGAGDAFLNLFARLAKIAPFFPLAAATVRFQPVWVGDVAASLAESLWRPESRGQTYPLCGPRQYTLAELVAYAAAVSGHPRRIIPLPDTVAWWQARLMELLPNPPLTRDNLRSMRLDSVCGEHACLPFGRVATPLEAIAPDYLACPRQ